MDAENLLGGRGRGRRWKEGRGAGRIPAASASQKSMDQNSFHPSGSFLLRSRAAIAVLVLNIMTKLWSQGIQSAHSSVLLSKNSHKSE